MINQLTAIGYGIICFAVLIGIGMVVLGSLASTVSSCPSGYTYQTNGTATYTNGRCCLNTGDSCTNAGNSTLPSTASQNLYTINTTYIGTNLVTWIPVIIVLIIGMLFLGAFLTKKGKSY